MSEQGKYPSFSQLLLLSLFLNACASAPPPPTQAPQWDALPARISDALCQRLKMDALATGKTTIVKVTQPLVTAQNLAALAGSTTPRGAKRRAAAAVSNRAIPIELGRVCAWDPIDVRDIDRLSDTMLVELSAPILHPYNSHEAGVIARVSLGNEHQSLYWISLAPRGEEWGIRFVSVLFE